MEENHQYYMRQCIKLANMALAKGNPPVGALLVLDGEVIGTGVESGKSTGDVTNHAEILAVREAVNGGYADRLNLSTLYTTHEPCIMCSYLIRHHHISRLIYGAPVPFVGGITSDFKILSTRDIPKWGQGPEIIGEICLNECMQLNEDFKKTLAKS